MKKLLLLAIVALFAMSCEGPMGPEGPRGSNGQNGWDGQDGQDGEGVSWETKSFKIKSEDWKLDGASNQLESYYYCTFRLDELTEYILDYGLIQGYFITRDNNGFIDSKALMPYTRHYGVEDEFGERLWTETIDLQAEFRTVTFYCTGSDFMTGQRPSTVELDLHLIW